KGQKSDRRSKPRSSRRRRIRAEARHRSDLHAYGSADAEVVTRIDAVMRSVEADLRFERLAAAALVRAANEDVVDAPIGFAQVRGVGVPPRERGAVATPDDAERVGEVDAAPP